MISLQICAKAEYPYTIGELGEATGTIPYGYEDETWKDKLTSYGGQVITYNEIGNPLSYWDGMQFSWQNGRQLSGMRLSDEPSVSYQYNPDGIWIGKTVNDTETSYFVDASGTMQAMKQGVEELVFLYDATGRREGFIWYHEGQKQGTYYYLYNMQSDVIGMVAEDMSPVVTYEYDAWGKLLNVSGEKKDTVGKLNPFRYRGYVYEEESGLYYVSSRYYDPEVGRWINTDAEIASVGSVQGSNLFQYCLNNSLNMSDPTGHWPKWIKKAATWVDNSIIKPIKNFFNPKTNAIGASLQRGYLRGTASLIAGYSEVMIRGQGGKKVIPKSGNASGTIGAFGKISGGNIAGKIGIGNKNTSLSVKGVGDVFTVSGQAGLKYQSGLGITINAKAAIFSGRATTELQLGGWQIEFGVTGDVGAVGAGATIGIFDGAFEMKTEAALGIGGGFVFRIKPN